MITTITLILSFLVAVNFLLLIFSCNKTTKKEPTLKPHIVKKPKRVTVVSSQLASTHLAPTGS